jgi:fatty acid desaturase
MKKAHSSVLSKINFFLVFAVHFLALGLLYFGSSLDYFGSFLLGIIFSFILLTNYALMHEGAHYNLHKSPKINWLLGALSSCLFPMSFTFFQITHQTHHYCNRTDHEMFDYYYPSDNKLIKFTQWYGILSGIWWFFIPLGSLLMALSPKLFTTSIVKKARSSQVLFDDFSDRDILKIRQEVVFSILYWAFFINLLSLNWQSLLIMYCCFAFNWSTRQYVTHAWTIRDVINGAANLKVSKPMSLILLNGEWDLVHHQQPNLPWNELAKEGQKSSEKQINYLSQYLSLWKGPCPNFEAAPLPKRII